jgi:hypothetical protein
MIDETELKDVVVERSVAIPMRDGVRLFADIWRPATDEALPVLVTRTPYNRASLVAMGGGAPLAREGYVVVSQDCRGRFESEGKHWCPVELDIDDGYDTVEWAAAQPWSNGKVGMFGASYMGYTQWQAAIARPPSLVAILPECSASEYWDPVWGPGGAFRMANRTGWTLMVALEEARRLGLDDPMVREVTKAQDAAGLDLVARSQAMAPIVRDLMAHRPLRAVPFFEKAAPWYAEYFDHEGRDHPRWLRSNPRSHYAEIDLPVIHVGGWYDVMTTSTIDAFLGMRGSGPTEASRQNQWMIIGPWTHWGIASGVVGDLDFGPDATLDIHALRCDWFGHWLHGNESAQLDRPPVRIFVMGENVWRDEHEWPLARTQWTPWHLQAEGHLGPDLPEASAPDVYTFDPIDPVPTLGGRMLMAAGDARGGPIEQGDVASRPDVLAYTSEPLSAPMEITGPVRVELWASTSAPDTDFTAKLVDVRPDGTSYNICDGIVRTRTVVAIPLQAGAVYSLPIDLAATSVLVPTGHRLQVQISSSSFPMWEPNANTANPAGTDRHEDLRPAHQQLFHDPAHPSRIVLPIIPR